MRRRPTLTLDMVSSLSYLGIVSYLFFNDSHTRSHRKKTSRSGPLTHGTDRSIRTCHYRASDRKQLRSGTKTGRRRTHQPPDRNWKCSVVVGGGPTRWRAALADVGRTVRSLAGKSHTSKTLFSFFLGSSLPSSFFLFFALSRFYFLTTLSRCRRTPSSDRYRKRDARNAWIEPNDNFFESTVSFLYRNTIFVQCSKFWSLFSDFHSWKVLFLTGRALCISCTMISIFLYGIDTTMYVDNSALSSETQKDSLIHYLKNSPKSPYFHSTTY